MGPITYSKDGGPVSAELSVGNAQTGSYVMKLWEAQVNQIVDQKSGNFIDQPTPSYQFPEPNEVNDGRRFQAIITIAILPPISEYSTVVKILQDGKELGQIPYSGKTDKASVTLNLHTTLQMAPVVTDDPAGTEPVADGAGTGGGTT